MTRWMSVALLAYFSWCLAADHLARLGDWRRPAAMCPWEFKYAEHDSGLAVKSAWWHRGNPEAYLGAIAALRQAGDFKTAAALVRIENRMDVFKLCR